MTTNQGQIAMTNNHEHTATESNGREGAELTCTGERLLPEGYEKKTITEHLHRYAFALSFADGKAILDVACGEGYGSALLARQARRVVGVDIAGEAVEHARRKYRAPNLTFVQGSADSLPLESQSVDLVVSFETIEHHDRHDEMMTEVKRVLKDDGLFIISVPDRRWYSEERGYQNPYHVRELYRDEFRELIKRHFANHVFLCQRNIFCSLLVPEAESGRFIEFSGDYYAINIHPGLARPLYHLCLASNSHIPDVFTSSFEILDICVWEKEILEREIQVSCKEAELNKLHKLLPIKMYRLVRTLFRGKN